MKLSAIWHFFFGAGPAITVFTGSSAATLQKITTDGVGAVIQPAAAAAPGPVPFGLIVPHGERWVPEFTVRLPRQYSIDRTGWGSATLPKMQTDGAGRTVAPIPAVVGAGFSSLQRIKSSGWAELDMTQVEDEELLLFI